MKPHCPIERLRRPFPQRLLSVPLRACVLPDAALQEDAGGARSSVPAYRVAPSWWLRTRQVMCVRVPPAKPPSAGRGVPDNLDHVYLVAAESAPGKVRLER